MNRSNAINAFCTVVRMRGATVHVSGAHGAVIVCDSEAQVRDVAAVASRRALLAEVRGLDVFVS